MKISLTSLTPFVLAGLVLQPSVAAAQTAAPQTTSAATAPRAAATAPVAAARTSGIRPWNEQEYRLGPGDKLRVEVFREAQLSQSLQIRPDGRITLPLVGDVSAAGRTSLELRDAITTELKEYVTNPVVTVIVQDALANQIYVIGEVSSPGPQVLQGPVTILQALSQAGGLKEFAKAGNISVLRKTATGQQRIEANYKDAMKGKADPLVLQPGDTVVVP